MENFPHQWLLQVHDIVSCPPPSLLHSLTHSLTWEYIGQVYIVGNRKVKVHARTGKVNSISKTSSDIELVKERNRGAMTLLGTRVELPNCCLEFEQCYRKNTNLRSPFHTSKQQNTELRMYVVPVFAVHLLATDCAN